MIAIAKELGFWPPAIISNPMQHLLDELSSVKDYPVQEKAKVDVLSSTRQRLQEFSSRWEAGHTPDDLAFDSLMRGSADPAEALDLAAQSDVLSKHGIDALSWVFINEGIALDDEAKTLSGKAARAKFAEAGRKFAATLRIKPDSLDALYNWGSVLGGEARTLSGKAARAKLAEAEKKVLLAKSLSGKAKYNLAGVFARTGRLPEAQAELAACQKDGTLPTLEHLQNDSDMDALRDSEEFQALLDGLET